MSEGTSKRLDGRWQVRIDRKVWDSGLFQQTTPSAALVYLTLHAYKRTRGRTDQERSLLSEGYVVSPVRLTTLSQATGMAKSTLKVALSTLEDLGWIQVHRARGRPGIYVLGQGPDLYVFPDGHRAEIRPTPQPPTGPKSGPPTESNRAEIQPTTGPKSGPHRAEIRPTLLNIPKGTDRKGKERSGVSGSRPIRKAIKPTPVPSPTTRGGSDQSPTPKSPAPGVGSKWAKERARYLKSAQARRAQGNVAYTSDELVALWCHRYEQVFGHPDLDLRTKTAWKKAARLIERRAAQWFEGDRVEIRTYLGATIGWWAKSLEEKREFPGGLPRLEQLLEEKRSGAVSYFYKHWRAGGMKR